MLEHQPDLAPTKEDTPSFEQLLRPKSLTLETFSYFIDVVGTNTSVQIDSHSVSKVLLVQNDVQREKVVHTQKGTYF